MRLEIEETAQDLRILRVPSSTINLDPSRVTAKLFLQTPKAIQSIPEDEIEMFFRPWDIPFV